MNDQGSQASVAYNANDHTDVEAGDETVNDLHWNATASTKYCSSTSWNVSETY